MTRFILLAALAVAVGGGTASADCGSCGGDGKYGWHPMLKLRSLFGRGSKCDTCGGHGKLFGPRVGLLGHGCGHGGCGGGFADPNAQPQGTLVFPNHPFARSPRDFFMYEPK